MKELYKKFRWISFVIVFCLLGGVTLTNASEGQNHSVKPKDGFVPNAETAIQIAVAVWIPIYGKADIEEERPFKAQLENGTWTVTGSLPDGYMGGVAIAEISKEDGRILRVSHGK